MTPRAPASPERAALHQFIARHHKFLLTTHINPDGDAIGSEVAFARMLRALGKSARVLNDSPTPHALVVWPLTERGSLRTLLPRRPGLCGRERCRS